MRIYLPPDANSLLSVADHCLRTRNYVNVIVAGKQPELQWLDDGRRVLHCARGHRHLGVGEQRRRRRARCRDGVRRRRPDARDAGRGRASSASTFPTLQVRVVNVVDLMRAAPETEHPHGLSRPRVRHALHRPTSRSIFAFHGYPYADPPARVPAARTTTTCTCAATRRKGTTTTPFDMVVLNDLDRFHLVMDVIDRVPGLGIARRPPAPADDRRPHPSLTHYTASSARTSPRSRNWTWPG